jgi:hypothetical protein
MSEFLLQPEKVQTELRFGEKLHHDVDVGIGTTIPASRGAEYRQLLHPITAANLTDSVDRYLNARI